MSENTKKKMHFKIIIYAAQLIIKKYPFYSFCPRNPIFADIEQKISIKFTIWKKYKKQKGRFILKKSILY